ncbi:uncharacterized protein LOC121277290 [Carcharodon carcharias]|uniref:uncharacterized protein LOC121277290 n=1 Tax=Carcharodon carcharias TaxID=13397 RepID=UPI001B7F1298|nr:uncharacterized protein LOC121277290 [Carcharodon carcharias]
MSPEVVGSGAEAELRVAAATTSAAKGGPLALVMDGVAAALSGSPCLLVRGSERLLEVPAPRRSREFTPEELKDSVYWERRRRNNEAARRSRQKRRFRELVLERRLLELLEENCRLRAHLLALRLPDSPPSPPVSPAARGGVVHTQGDEQPGPGSRAGSVPGDGAGSVPGGGSQPAWIRSLPHKLRLKISSSCPPSAARPS